MTSVLALTGTLLAPLAFAQEPPPSEDSKKQAAQTPEGEKQADDASKPPSFREEVVVTAQKRTEAVQDIPASVTVVGGELLEQQRADDFQDLVPLVPGLSTATSRPGVTRITLRGINTGGVASTIGVYYDDVPFGSSSGLANAAVVSGDFDTFDLARVEVLRGPQGTLYGASSLGGVIKYVPNRPSSERFETRFLGSAETVDNGDLGYNVTGLVNVPLTDKAAIRASGFYRFDSGFIDSIGNNPVPSLTNPGVNVLDGTIVDGGINSLDRFGGRFAALFKPSDSFTINLGVQLQNLDSGAASIVDADPDSLEPLNSGPVQSRYQLEENDTKYRVYNATLDWNLGAASLQSITSFGSFESDFHSDLTIAANLTGGPPLASLVTLLFGDASARPLSAVLPQTTSTDKFSQELRLLSAKSEKLEWLIGGYYTDEDSAIKQKIVAVEAGTETFAAGIPDLADVSLESTYEEIAGFANATWHAAPRFDLALGGRLSHNKQVASQVSDGVLVGGLTRYDDVESSETPFTFSVAPRFELGGGSSVYGRVATGFRPGGPNVLPPGAPADIPRTYDSDRLTSYELGLKTGGGPTDEFQLDVSAFYLDWEDVQLFLVVNDFGINGNGGTAVSKGLELAASLYPTSGLVLSVNGAYTDAELTQDTDPIVGGEDGDPLPYVPEWSFGLNADYEWTLTGSTRAYVGGSLGYTGERTAEFGNRAADGGIRKVDGYTTLNLRAGAYLGRWSVELYGKNLTNEQGITEINPAGALPNGALGLGLIRPRTVGISVGTRFWGS
ncbi:MAG TPA: TonB-dependent receptor [Vicinamibacteria bacterium]|nr:TonB-dependent receptor [Vicinamibacteria bacterium]